MPHGLAAWMSELRNCSTQTYLLSKLLNRLQSDSLGVFSPKVFHFLSSAAVIQVFIRRNSELFFQNAQRRIRSEHLDLWRGCIRPESIQAQGCRNSPVVPRLREASVTQILIQFLFTPKPSLW